MKTNVFNQGIFVEGDVLGSGDELAFQKEGRGGALTVTHGKYPAHCCSCQACLSHSKYCIDDGLFIAMLFPRLTFL